jgi:hypothetical protein
MTQPPKISKRSPVGPSRGLLARPLDALVFLLPLILFYEIVSLSQPDRVVAFELLRRFLELFGHFGVWAPGVAVVIILVATHIASGEPWRVHWKRVGWMYVEAMMLAAPLLLFNWAIPLVAGSDGSSAFVHRVAMGIGAGIYEELVFRLVMISLIVMVGADVFRLDRGGVAVAAVALSALAFAAHHHQPIGQEPFDATLFTFRTLAGVYLSVIFWYRGYGPAAGCHAAYNVALAVVGVRR